MSAPVRRQHQPPAPNPSDPLRTGIHVSADGGRLQATVDLYGDLDPLSVPQLRHELGQLIDDGITEITVDLEHVQLCTSHGLDLFDEVHARLRQHHAGGLGLRIERAPHAVRRVVDIVREHDPTFSPPVV